MWGSIIFTDSIDEVKNLIASQFTIVAMVDDQRRYQQLGFVTMGALLPPESAIFAEIDQNYPMAQSIYEQYLSGPGLEYIAALIAALYAGKKLALYLPADESMNFGFIQVFAQFWAKNFGITIGSSAVDSSMDIVNPEFMANIANMLYGFNMIPFQVYCNLVPANAIPNEIVVGKIMRSLNYSFPSMEIAVQFCSQYINNEKYQQSLIESGKQQNASPVFRVNGL